MNKLSKRIKQLRIKNNLTRLELATKLNFSLSCITKWENSRANIFSHNLIKIAKIFNVTVDYLVGLED